MARILLYRSQGLLSNLIRWQTDSPYTHAALLFDDCVIESLQGSGVHKIALDRVPWDEVDVYRVQGMTPDIDRSIRELAEDQIGQGYDYWGIARFISRRRLPVNDKWFCSELVFELFRHAGIKLLHRIDAQQVSPGMLAYSPLLEPDV